MGIRFCQDYCEWNEVFRKTFQVHVCAFMLSKEGCFSFNDLSFFIVGFLFSISLSVSAAFMSASASCSHALPIINEDRSHSMEC